MPALKATVNVSRPRRACEVVVRLVRKLVGISLDIANEGRAARRSGRRGPGFSYLVILIMRSIPSWMCSRWSCVSMKHAST